MKDSTNNNNTEKTIQKGDFRFKCEKKYNEIQPIAVKMKMLWFMLLSIDVTPYTFKFNNLNIV